MGYPKYKTPFRRKCEEDAVFATLPICYLRRSSQLQKCWSKTRCLARYLGFSRAKANHNSNCFGNFKYGKQTLNFKKDELRAYCWIPVNCRTLPLWAV